MPANLAPYLLALADDELILGHRDSEWCGHAPILEEDIAFANIALDEIGHARLWLELAAKELGEDPIAYPDQQVFFRDPADFSNIQMVELPNGDWAFTMLRQYLMDSFEIQRLDALKDSALKGVAEIAAKIRTEEAYHLRHTQAWVRRLALGTEESAARCQNALDELWPYAQQLAEPLPDEDESLPNSQKLFDSWQEQVIEFFNECQLNLGPQSGIPNLQRSFHTPHLPSLITDMQEVARTETGVRW